MQIGTIADILLTVMSCKDTNVQGLKVDPDKHSSSIDEVGY